MRITVEELATAVGGTIDGDPATVIDGATQDSRNVAEGNLFVPLLAERDGHEFIANALQSGAAAYLSQRKAGDDPGGGVAIRVADTGKALVAAGRLARERITGPVIGITGSVGKTTTKDLLAAALSRGFSTHASEKSFNNEIGVPLTLLNAPDGTEAAIVEMGARGIGHITTLCQIAQPTVGIVTTVAGAHTGEFGSIDNIALAKGELIESLPETGLAIVNHDNPWVLPMAERTSADVITFGESADATVRIVDVDLDEELRPTIELETRWGTVVARPPIRGAHLAPNVAAAAAAALGLGVAPDAVQDGLAEAAISPWRMEVFRTPDGATVINDSYNANPTSMAGAIDSLARLAHRRKIAVLGYMAELGDDEAADHRSVAELVRENSIELLAVGTDLYGVDPAADVSAALERLGETGADTAVLIKASRSAGLDRLADTLR